jgi:hypothetical protein
MCIRDRPDPDANEVVGAYVELHVAECPPDYAGDSLFDDCHDRRVPGVPFVFTGAGGETYTLTSDERGVIVAGDFYAAGELRIEAAAVSVYPAHQVYCSVLSTGDALPVEVIVAEHQAARFVLPQAVIDRGEGVVCDWYFFAPADGGLAAEPPPSAATVLGASIDQWELTMGPGIPAGLMLAYQEGTIAARFETGRLVQIELEWLREGARTVEEARSAVISYLPIDAVLVEQFERSPHPGWTPNLIVDRFASTALAEQLAGQPLPFSESILVIYEAVDGTGGASSEQLLIERVSIVVGMKR